mgnify:CR=1 FL=1
MRLAQICIVSVLAASACTQNSGSAAGPPSAVPPTPQQTAFIPANGRYSGHGKVTKVNLDAGSVEIAHDDIPGLMPAMQMEFFVADRGMLRSVSPNDNVDFIIEYQERHETIVDLTKVK